MAEVWLVGDWAAGARGQAVAAALGRRALAARPAAGWPGGADPAALVAEAGEGWPARLAAARAAGWTGAALLLVEGDPAAALDAGADDAVAPGASAAEIAARVAARLRTPGRAPPGRTLEVGALQLDRDRQQARIGGHPLRLRPREWLLLHRLAEAGRALSRAELLREVFGLSIDPGTNVVAVQVSRLRAELARSGAAGMIETLPAGYRLRPLDPASAHA